MNYKFIDGCEKIVFCGMSYIDLCIGICFEQDCSVWFKNYGVGKIVYFQFGYFVEEYVNVNIVQMILNVIVWDEC